MNLFLLKYMIMIAGILGTTAMVAGPVQNIVVGQGMTGDNVSADAVYQFGSGLFYKEVAKPGNEYMRSSVEGYSENLIQGDNDTASFSARWQEGVGVFKTGYAECSDAYLQLTEVPMIRDQAGKNAAWEKMHAGKDDIARSADLFTAAKSYASPGSSIGFTIGMVLPRIGEIETDAEDAELASMEATLADRDHNATGFDEHLREVGAAIGDMKRIYPELKVLSDDF